MSQSGHSTNSCGGDGAAYVLGALEQSEHLAFERHLSGCEACREDVAGMSAVADALAAASPQFEVSPELRRNVIATVRSEARARRFVSRRSASRRSASRRLRGAGRWARSGPRPALAGVFALLLIVVAVVVWTGGSTGARVVQASVVDSPGTAQLRLGGRETELSVRHFPAPAPGTVYEVWLRRGDGPLTPTDALFTVDDAGQADTGIPESLHGFSEILVTEEPAGGSRVPTHPAVIVARISASAS